MLRKADKVADVAKGISRARELGLAGERAAGITGAKKAINVAGQTRVPDKLTATALIEVKNVKKLSYTKQLRDFTTFARDEQLDFILVTRPGTKLSGPLKTAIANGDIIHRPMLPF
jgi:hypothetical protein